MRAPAAWISICSREKSRNIRSITRSACLSASIAGRLSPSGVTPTVQAPASPVSVEEASGRRTWNGMAPKRRAAAMKASA